MSAALPPHNLAAERAILGGGLVNNAEIADVADALAPEDFYRAAHGAIWREMVALAARRDPVDVATVTAALQAVGGADAAAGLRELPAIDAETEVTAGLVAYAVIVRGAAQRRALLAIARQAASDALSGEGGTAELVERVQRETLALSVGRDVRAPRSLADLARPALKQLEVDFERGTTVTGRPTGISQLDQMTTGLHGGELVVVAGRPSMGKTALAMRIARATAEAGGEVVVFSQEQPGDQLAKRELSTAARVDSQRIRAPVMLADTDWSKLARGVDRIHGGYGRRIWIDDAAGVSAGHIAATARRLKARTGGLALVVVDYLQIMDLGRNAESRERAVAEASGQMKALARALDVPVLLLSQLNRGLENRPEKRPRKADLRESGAIENDADVILLVHREEVFCTTCAKGEDCGAGHKGIAELILDKQRNGPTGTVRVAFQGAYTSFENLAEPGARP